MLPEKVWLKYRVGIAIPKIRRRLARLGRTVFECMIRMGRQKRFRAGENAGVSVGWVYPKSFLQNIIRILSLFHSGWSDSDLVMTVDVRTLINFENWILASDCEFVCLYRKSRDEFRVCTRKRIWKGVTGAPRRVLALSSHDNVSYRALSRSLKSLRSRSAGI